MLELDLGEPAGSAYRVLCLGAHSDDIEIGCGGTVLALLERLRQRGRALDRFQCQRGEGPRGPGQRRRLPGPLRLEKEVVVKEFRDGFFPFLGGAIKDEFETLKRELQPRPGLHSPPRRPAPGPPPDLRPHLEYVSQPPDPGVRDPEV